MSTHEPEATPAQQEAVRRLLAEARHDGPVPPDVAARLDATLAGLAAEGPQAVDPPAPPPGAPVVDLAARRRRRAVGLLGAAAAVVVLGVAAGQLVGTTTGGGDDSSSAGGSAAFDEQPTVSSDAEGASGAESDPQDEAAPSSPAPAPNPAEAPPDSVYALNGRTFVREVRRIRDTATPTPSRADAFLSGADLTTSSMFVCPGADWGEGDLVAVRYAGRPAVLAFRPPVGDTQTVDLLQCGSGEVLRSTTLPD
jgi:hypothetical protein